MKIIVIPFYKMKRYIKFMSAISIIVILAILFGGLIGRLYPEIYISASAEEQTRTVIIDAGHGGEDPGAIGADGTLEKDLNLAIAMNIGNLLTERGITVIYTRTEDKLLYKESENIKGIRKISDLKNRCQVANDNPSAIFVSIHMNTFGASKYSGLQVYKKDNSSSESLANQVKSSVKESLQPDNERAVKSGNEMYVLENSPGEAILIECGFLSNPEECKKLSEKEYQNKLSFAIVCGIINYMDTKNAS